MCSTELHSALVVICLLYRIPVAFEMTSQHRKMSLHQTGRHGDHLSGITLHFLLHHLPCILGIFIYWLSSSFFHFLWVHKHLGIDNDECFVCIEVQGHTGHKIDKAFIRARVFIKVNSDCTYTCHCCYSVLTVLCHSPLLIDIPVSYILVLSCLVLVESVYIDINYTSPNVL